MTADPPNDEAAAAFQRLMRAIGVGEEARDRARRRAAVLIGCLLGIALLGWLIVDLGSSAAP